MCEVMEKLMKEYRVEAFNKGVAEATAKFVRNLLAEKEMSYEEIAKAVDTSVDEVIRIANKSGIAY